MKKVSVIIPTYNESDVIADCIKSLQDQTLSDLEILVVDDGSTDATNRLINGIKTKNTHLFTQNHKGPGLARNLGAQKSSGNILVFVDADMTFEKDFVEKLIQPIVDGKSKGTFSKEEYVSNWSNPIARSWNINEGWAKKMRHPENYPDTQKVFRAILRSEFERVGGFEPGGHYTDDYLAEKLGYEATAASGAKFYHNNPEKFADVFTQAKWVAKRKYKLGVVGYLVAMVRALVKAINPYNFFVALQKKEPFYIPFKVVYEIGIFVGILEYLAGKEGR